MKWQNIVGMLIGSFMICAAVDSMGWPGWVMGVGIGVLAVVMAIAEAAQKKEDEKRADELALKKHEARLRVKADLRREKEALPGQSRLGPEHLKAFEKPEVPNGQQPMDSRL